MDIEKYLTRNINARNNVRDQISQISHSLLEISDMMDQLSIDEGEFNQDYGEMYYAFTQKIALLSSENEIIKERINTQSRWLEDAREDMVSLIRMIDWTQYITPTNDRLADIKAIRAKLGFGLKLAKDIRDTLPYPV